MILYLPADVLVCQSLLRRHLATKLVEKTRRDIAVARAIEKRIKEAKMSTVISANWKRFYWQKLYKQSVGGMSVLFNCDWTCIIC